MAESIEINNVGDGGSTTLPPIENESSCSNNTKGTIKPVIFHGLVLHIKRSNIIFYNLCESQ